MSQMSFIFLLTNPDFWGGMLGGGVGWLAITSGRHSK